MPTLNKTKKETQIIFKWGGISLAIIFLFLTGMRLFTVIKESMTPPPPPASSFGKLSAIPFPNQVQTNITYTLDTLSGFLPNFSDRTKVYKIDSAKPTLLALDKIQAKVSQLGFNSKGLQIAQDVYQWTDLPSTLQRRITVNIFSQVFTLSSPYLINLSLQKIDNQADQNNAIELAKSFISTISPLPEDIDTNKTTVTFYSIKQAALVPTTNVLDAKIIKVDFFQKDLDSLPIYYEKGVSSTLNALIAKENNQLKIVEAHYFNPNISQTSSAYAIKSASQAYSQLKQGKAYIASQPPNTVEIVIKKVLLGYYIGESQEDFLMPIFIFLGDNDFIAYVSAVRDEWINN